MICTDQALNVDAPSAEISTEILSSAPMNPTPSNSTNVKDSCNVISVSFSNEETNTANNELTVTGESYTVLKDNFLDIIDTNEVDDARSSLVITEGDLIPAEMNLINEIDEGNKFFYNNNAIIYSYA